MTSVMRTYLTGWERGLTKTEIELNTSLSFPSQLAYLFGGEGERRGPGKA